MMFRWLPDPGRYRHPCLAWLFQFACDVLLRSMFRIEHDLPPGFEAPPGAVMVSNHLRDSDVPILATLAFRRKGVHMRGVLPFFAMREDLFQRGSMANLLYTCPWPFIHLLRLVPLRQAFRSMRTLPVRRLREFTWHDTLRELVRSGSGSRAPAEVFNARGLRELRECLGAVPARVDEINPWQMGLTRVARWGLRRLNAHVLRDLAPDFRATITHHLEAFVRRLEEGASVYFAPEGGTSVDGRFGRIRAGIWLLGRMRHAPLPFLPFAISYDPLGPGRPRAIVRIGTVLPDPDVDDPRELACEVRRAIVAHRVITPSHLLAWFLCVRKAPFTTRELVDWLGKAKVLAGATGLELDPAFGRASTAVLVVRRLRWLRRKHLVRCRAGVWHVRYLTDTPPSWLHTEGIVRYLANALADLAPGMVEALPSCR